MSGSYMEQLAFVGSKLTSLQPIEADVQAFESSSSLSYRAFSNVLWEYAGGRDKGYVEAAMYRFFANRSGGANNARAVRDVLTKFEAQLANKEFDNKGWTLFEGTDELIQRLDDATPKRSETGYLGRIIAHAKALSQLGKTSASSSVATAHFDHEILNKSRSTHSSLDMSAVETVTTYELRVDNIADEADIFDNVGDDDSESSCTI